MEPIGVIHSGLSDTSQAPRQGREAGLLAQIEIFPPWRPGLEGLAPGRWLWVIYHFHLAGPPKLKVHPRRDPSRPLTGVFNTRSPRRPNPLALCLVRLEEVQDGLLTVRGLEAVEGTPVIDIKPYIPRLDQPGEDEA
ncbi:MAG: tRNA (N6-threonylcarbamoyladenosine(37)-N6)-methyltransferase TrmO [Desulfarculus sp.]|nr:MAG: tRNA (N6-threonylcarbamoyladenosine(37)-N6)-methyltransferase TrmO [Desulfarculus sp.]